MGSVANTVIDVESLVASMENKKTGNQLHLSPEYCIFKTPSILARHNPEAYIPNRFSFGPFHHGQQNLMVSEKIKLKYLLGLLSRSASPLAMFRECLDSIEKVELKARDCYEGKLDQEVKEFVEMLVVDGCFIIELFRKDANVVRKEDDDPIFSRSCILQFLHHDLICLENQIPWLVLELLFDKTKAPSETKSLIQLALDFFGNMFSSHKPDLRLDLFVDQKVKHILDLLRLSLVLPSAEIQQYERRRRDNQQDLEWQPIRSVSRLTEAGVKFSRVKVSSILDIKYINGVLEIPSLLIQETTETIFRNLISYEQCLPNCKPVFTSYAKIMDNLIDTTHDMEILCKKDVLDNWLSPEDAKQFFNKLYSDTYMKEFYYADLCNKVNGHCQQLWPRWRAAYVHNYFTKPWVVAAQIYAIIMFTLALWQALKKGRLKNFYQELMHLKSPTARESFLHQDEPIVTCNID